MAHPQSNTHYIQLPPQWAQFFDEDTINAVSGVPYFIGQKSNDNEIGGATQKGKTDALVEDGMVRLFDSNALAAQVKTNMNLFPIPYNVTANITLAPECNSGFSYVPSHTLSVYLVDAPDEPIVSSREEPESGGEESTAVNGKESKLFERKRARLSTNEAIGLHTDLMGDTERHLHLRHRNDESD